MSAPALPAVGATLAETSVAFDSDRIAAYALASGDTNPLHTDPELARRAGFAAPLVHGMLVMAAFEPALVAWRPDLRVARLQGRFLQPLLAGEVARIGGRVVRADDESVTLRLVAQGPARVPAIMGEARLVRRARDPAR